MDTPSVMVNSLVSGVGYGLDKDGAYGRLKLKALVFEGYYPSTNNENKKIDNALAVTAPGASGDLTCPGDSGGPLLLKTASDEIYLVGVASFISTTDTSKDPREACKAGQHALFTTLGHYKDWIVQQLPAY